MDNNARALQRLRKDPKLFLENGRNGTFQDLMDLVNIWDRMAPQLLSLGLLDVLFYHLRPEAAPSPTAVVPRTKPPPIVERAYLCFVALTKVGTFTTPKGEDDPWGVEIAKGWPGIFKWSAYFYAARIHPRNVDLTMKRGMIDLIGGTWYSISRSGVVRKIMTDTPGSVELATQIWIIEDVGPESSTLEIPAVSAALDTLLSGKEPDTLNRVLKSAGGNADNVVQLSLSRLRSSINGSDFRKPRTAVYLDFLGHLSRIPTHPFRLGLLHNNIIATCAKIAARAARELNEGGNAGLMDVLTASFGYLYSCLDSTEGFTWVVQALNNGMLTAWVDASPHFIKLEPEDCTMIIAVVRDILPRYLVYRSVIQAVDGAIQKVQTPEREKYLSKSIGQNPWITFKKLALERLMVTIHAKAVKGKAVTCDNVQCQKVDSKNNFRKCSGCATTLYCSKDCQIVAWKEGGHRTMCKLKQRETLEGKSRSISKGDAAFFHHLATRDARHNLPYLRRLAKERYPDRTRTGLVICIDYHKLPEVYDLVPLDEYEERQPTISPDASANAEARNDALIERAREHPGKFTIIQSKIINGQGMQLVLTIVTGGFWEDGEDIWTAAQEAEREEMGLEASDINGLNGDEKALDGVDIMMARFALNSFLRSRGEPETF